MTENFKPYWTKDAPIMQELKNKMFVSQFNEMADDIHQNAVNHGWWDENRNEGEMIALMHSELSEALEGLREGNPPDKHCPKFTSVEVELADVIIRIMDLAPAKNWRIAEALVAKHEYNKSREHKHGGKKF